MTNETAADFREVGHSGGKVTFHVETRTDGTRFFQIGWHLDRPSEAGIIAVYALQEGIPVSRAVMGGINQPWSQPPVEDCFTVLIGSDSEGKFGKQCPSCEAYWRTDGWSTICAYCGEESSPHSFLTRAQRIYVKAYCATLSEAFKLDGDHVIDMDAVADAVGRDIPKPPFYYVEESQQKKFSCDSCGTFNDILGNFGYCSACGTRNDLQEMEARVRSLRTRANAGGPYEDCVRDAVAAFDSLTGRYVGQLVRRIPLTARRRALFQRARYHDLNKVSQTLEDVFDIDILKGLDLAEREFATRMFHRRHVYEHKGGEADEKYIADSGDDSVRVKQALTETQESANRIASVVLAMAKNLHSGFHEILPPIDPSK